MSSAASAQFSLFSDGGSSSGGSAAGAAIIEVAETKQRIHLVIFLGTATNNEAEILASLLGFSYLLTLADNFQGAPKIHWIADSEYLLKSATGYIFNWQRNGWRTADKKPVKNQGLWQAYLALTNESFKITPEHVRGHTGHPENESCDEAVGFMKSRGTDLFAGGSVREFCEIETTTGVEQWICLDGEAMLQRLRTDNPAQEDIFWMFENLKGVQIPTSSGNGALRAAREQSDGLPATVSKKLRDAADAAKAASAKSEKAKELSKALSQLLKVYGS